MLRGTSLEGGLDSSHNLAEGFELYCPSFIVKWAFAQLKFRLSWAQPQCIFPFSFLPLCLHLQPLAISTLPLRLERESDLV